LKDLLKAKYGELFEEQKRGDKLRIARWKDEDFNVIQLIFDPQAFFSPHLRISYINAKMDNTIKKI